MKVIQARDAKLDIEVSNIEALIAETEVLGESWDLIWKEAELIDSNLEIEIQIRRGRPVSSCKRKRLRGETKDTDFSDLSESEHFKINVILF